MAWYQQLLDWRENHHDLGLDLIRVFLGVALFTRGALFFADQSTLIAFIRQQQIDWLVPLIGIHYIILAHLYGGILLTLGFLTRISAVIQIPILMGAVLTIHLEQGLFFGGQSLELSVLVLFLLIAIFVFGPGTLSLDYYIFTYRKEEDAPEDNLDRTELARMRVERGREQREERFRAAQEQEHLKAEADAKHEPEVVVLTTPTRQHIITTQTVEVPSEPASAPQKLKVASKYIAVFAFAIVLFFSLILMSEVPIAITFEELLGIGGVVLLIFGLFYLFYRSAFSAD